MMSRRFKIAVAVIVPCISAAIFCIKDYLFGLAADRLPVCYFYALTGHFCPACGNTRSVRGLLSGDILFSLRNNLTMPFLALLVILLYVQLVFGIFGKKLRLIPRNMIFWGAVIAFFAVYYVVRNFVPQIAPI